MKPDFWTNLGSMEPMCEGFMKHVRFQMFPEQFPNYNQYLNFRNFNFGNFGFSKF